MTVGYSIWLINNNTLLITISDVHVDWDNTRNMHIAIDHAKQITKILDLAKRMSKYKVFFNMERREGESDTAILNSYILGQGVFNGYDPISGQPKFITSETIKGDYSGSITLDAARGRAIKNKKEDNLDYVTFDNRVLTKDGISYERNRQKFYQMIYDLPLHEKQQFAEKCYQDAQEIANKENVDENSKKSLLQSLENIIQILKKSFAPLICTQWPLIQR